MDRKLRRCAVCGTSYKFCSRCSEDKDKPLWFYTFCSESCKNIYDAASKFENGQITAIEAKAQLQESDLSRLSDFGASYRASMSKIDQCISVMNETLSPRAQGNSEEAGEIAGPTGKTDTDASEKPRNHTKNAATMKWSRR